MPDLSRSEAKRDRVVISYSRKDGAWLERLQAMLKPLVRERGISVWDDTQIQAGAVWKEEVRAALAEAKVAVLLVSPNFLASDFIAQEELPPLLNAAKREGVRIIWVCLSYCLYEITEIARYQAAHNPSQPLDSLSESEKNRVLVEICKQIAAAAQLKDVSPPLPLPNPIPSPETDYRDAGKPGNFPPDLPEIQNLLTRLTVPKNPSLVPLPTTQDYI